MTRRTVAKKTRSGVTICAVVLLTLSSVSCRTSRSSAPRNDGTVTHVVVCWLKSPGDHTARTRVIDASRAFLGEIPGLLDITAGTALPSTRPTVDATYDVAIVMTFRNEAALRAYNDHPNHKAAVEQVLRPLVGKLVIYDFADAK